MKKKGNKRKIIKWKKGQSTQRKKKRKKVIQRLKTKKKEKANIPLEPKVTDLYGINSFRYSFCMVCFERSTL